MSKRVFASGVVEDGGTVRLSRRGRTDADMLRVFGQGSPVQVTYEKPTRSLIQNALLWHLNSEIGRQIGMDPEEVHEYSKQELNLVHRTYSDKKTGEIKDVAFAGPTHTLPIDGMAEYIERFLRFWAERGYYVETQSDQEITQPQTER